MLWNQLIYAVISFVIVTTMSGKLLQVFGLFFFLLYLSGIYSYAHKAGNGHQKSYSKVRPNPIYPLGYGLIAVMYLAVPLAIYWCFQTMGVYLIVTFWNAPFFFGRLIFNDGVVNLMSAGIFSVIILFTCGMGYLAGCKQFSLLSLVYRLLYRKVESTDETNN